MSKRSKKLDKFVAIAEADERRTGEQMGRSRKELDEHLGRLGELHAFRQNYRGKGPTSGTIDSAHLKDYQNFLQRLDTAVRSQQQIVADSEQNVELHRRRWMAKRQRLESLERVLERYQQEEHQHAERLEQRALDELPGAASPYDEDEG